MLMLGNLFRGGVVRQLTEVSSMHYIVVILLGTSVEQPQAQSFPYEYGKGVGLGLVAFVFGTASGVIFGR